MNKESTAVLLASYNGEKYIGELLDSLCRQTFQDWVLYVHDDGSSDSTCDIITEYADRLNIRFLGEEKKHLGAKKVSFIFWSTWWLITISSVTRTMSGCRRRWKFA